MDTSSLAADLFQFNVLALQKDLDTSIGDDDSADRNPKTREGVAPFIYPESASLIAKLPQIHVIQVKE